MSYGMQVYAADGVTLIFDSRVVQGGVLAEVPVITSAVPTVRTYPAFAGRIVFAMDLWGVADTQVSVDYALGYPRVTFPGVSPSLPRAYLVFAK